VWWRGWKTSWWQRGLESLRARWRESVERETCCRKRKKTGEEAGFLSTLDSMFFLSQAINALDSMFFLSQAINAALFISGGRGKSCLHWEKISALDSVAKDPNRWFKLASLSCQICRKRLPELTSSRRRRCRRVVIHPETFTWGCRGTAGDPFSASLF